MADKYIRSCDVHACIKAMLEIVQNLDNAGDNIKKVASLGLTYVDDFVISLPAADVVAVRHGRWQLDKNGRGTCDQCHFTQRAVWDQDKWQRYCGVCGAEMKGAISYD